jgi:hypothetical protein
MTTLELKTEIHKAIENTPADALPKIFDFINSVNDPSADKDELDRFIDKVFKEDDNLLRRLAQ